MRFTLSRKSSLHLPIQAPPLSACAHSVHVCMISCDVRYPDAPSSWLVICPPAQLIDIGSTIHFHLESGQASHIFASVEYVSSLDKHAVEFAVSYPVASATNKDPRKAWAYLSVLRDWALLPPVLSSIHHLLYDFLPASLPSLKEGTIPDPITPWTSPCIHIRHEQCGIRLRTPAAVQKRTKEFFVAYVCLIGRPPSPPPSPSPPLSASPPAQPLRISLPALPQRAAHSVHSKRAATPLVRPVRIAYTPDQTVLTRPTQAVCRTF